MLVETSDHEWVRTIVLNRPEKRNAFDGALLRDLGDSLRDAAADEAVKVVVLTGAGPAFSAGADFAELSALAREPKAEPAGRTAPAKARTDSKAAFDRLIETLTSFPKPLLVAVNGSAAGFGLTILGFADLVFLSEEARLRCPFTELGLAPEAASSYLLPKLVGRQNAAWILLSSEWISAQEALEMGLAWRLCSPADTLPTAQSYASSLARRPLASLVAVKQAMVAPLADATAAAHAREMQAFLDLRR